jgi:hypothetical protein
MSLSVILAPTTAIADMACSFHAPCITWLMVDSSNHLIRFHIEMLALRTALIIFRSRERMLIGIFRCSLPGAEQATSIVLIVMCPYMLAEIALEDNPCGLRYYCHLYTS